MGAVALARHVSLDETVAIKFLRPDLRRDPVAIARLSREAKALARIKSDHVARVLDVGVTLSVGPYMVMEYLEGTDLGELLETEGPLPASRAVECVLQVCEALTVAHTAGITHRDIKPQNLFLARHGQFETLKVLDFGIAEDLNASGPSSSGLSAFGARSDDRELADPNSQLGRANESGVGPASVPAGASKESNGSSPRHRDTAPLYGTPSYMSPERVRNDGTADHRSDIWSVGVVLHELVTGRAVFDGGSITETCARILSEQAPDIETNDFVLPPSLRVIIARCLERDLDRRYQSIEELAAALAPLATMHERFRGRSTGAFSRRMIEEELARARKLEPATLYPTAIATKPGVSALAQKSGGLEAWLRGAFWGPGSSKYVTVAVASALAAALVVPVIGGMTWMAPPPAVEAEPLAKAAPSSPSAGVIMPAAGSAAALAPVANGVPSGRIVPVAGDAPEGALAPESPAGVASDNFSASASVPGGAAAGDVTALGTADTSSLPYEASPELELGAQGGARAADSASAAPVQVTAALSPQRRRSDGERTGLARVPSRGRRHVPEPEANAPAAAPSEANDDARMRLVGDRPSRVRLVNDRLVTNRPAKTATGAGDGAPAANVGAPTGAKPTPARAAKSSLPSWLQSFRSPR